MVTLLAGQHSLALGPPGTAKSEMARGEYRQVYDGRATEAAEAVRGEAALTRAWGVDSGAWERMPFDQRARLAERLRTSRLAQWAELIGRFPGRRGPPTGAPTSC